MSGRNKNRSAPRPVTADTPMPPLGRSLPRAWMAAAVLAVSLIAAYYGALNAPFIYDDKSAIVSNHSIKSLWPLAGTADHPGPLNPPADSPLSARPLINLSFAMNYSFGGFNPTGYHAVNLAIHFFSSLFLWAITWRALRLPYFAGRFETSAGWLALAAALLWALHPLQTEAVIYATQRTELMMALFYLATLYCSLRYWAPHALPSQRAIWLTLAVFASLAGMASKEVMVSAPLMVLLFERTFIAGSLANALRRSWPLYVGLASTWVLLVSLGLNAPHGETAGFGLGVSAPAWWLTQTKVLLLYLKLVVWPWPLLVHYQFPYLATFAESWMFVVPLLLLGGVTLVLLWRNHPVGYLGTWLFAILAPTSVVPIITEMAAERRMYLPLAALVVLLVVGGCVLVQSVLRRSARNRQTSLDSGLPFAITVGPALVLAVAFGLVSATRLTAYNDEAYLWRQVLQFQPNNSLAHGNLGGLLLGNADRLQDATDELQAALALKPDYPDALNNLGVALTHAGRLPEALDALHAALAIEPDYPAALNNLGLALTQMGRYPNAIECFEHALRLHPDDAGAHNCLAIALYRNGQRPLAIEQFRMAVQYDDNNANAHSNLGQLLNASGNVEEAITHLEKAVQLQPGLVDAHHALADAYRKTDRPNQAIEHYQAVLKLKPDLWQAYANLARTLALLNRSEESLVAAQKGIEVARAAGQPAAAEQMKEWLQHYQAELRRNENVANPSKSQPSSE